MALSCLFRNFQNILRTSQEGSGDARFVGPVRPNRRGREEKPGIGKEEIERKKRIRTISSMALASMLALAVTQNSVFAKDQACSNASLKGSYGFYGTGFNVPAGTPR